MRKISVCMATYNGERFIRAQIESVLSQLEENDEIIICDDNSSDGTVKVIEGINDSRIRFFRNEKNLGYTANFEKALSKSNGDYVILCDQDDVWLEKKVDVVKRKLQEFDFIMSDAKVVDTNLNVIHESRNKYYGVRNGFVRNFIKTRYLGCCMAFRKDVLDFALPFPKNRNLCLHDAWISLCAEMYFKTTVIDQPLILYRRHESNASSGGETHSGFFKIISIRSYLLMNLLKRGIVRRFVRRTK